MKLAFSSKGLHALTLEILKPDVSTSGLNILTVWSLAFERMHIPGPILSRATPIVAGIIAKPKAYEMIVSKGLTLVAFGKTEQL